MPIAGLKGGRHLCDLASGGLLLPWCTSGPDAGGACLAYPRSCPDLVHLLDLLLAVPWCMSGTGFGSGGARLYRS